VTPTPTRAGDADLPAHCVTRHSFRVRFFETDLMGIVHHAAYLTYAEAARVEYLRRRGAEYRALTESGIHMPVVEAQLEYRRAARFDDLLDVDCRLGALTRVTVRFDCEIFRAGELLTRVSVRLACVDAAHRPRRMPADLDTLLRAPESDA